MRWTFWILLVATACGPTTRIRRALAPERFVAPQTPVGEHAAVVVATGWPNDPVLPYQPEVAYEIDGETWIRPVEVTHKGDIRVFPAHAGLTMRVYRRHIGVGQRDFHELAFRSGTLRGRLETAIRPSAPEPLGTEARHLHLADFTNPYGDDRVEDGDLLLLELTTEDRTEVEQYLFKNVRYGIRSRFGAGLLLRIPLPWGEPTEGRVPAALAVTGAFGYRFRHASPAIRFFEERVMLVASAGIASTVLETPDLGVTDLVRVTVVGGGIQLYDVLSLQAVVNAASPFDDSVPTAWSLAVGIDAVQLAKFAYALLPRLWREHPLAEDDPRPERDL